MGAHPVYFGVLGIVSYLCKNLETKINYENTKKVHV